MSAARDQTLQFDLKIKMLDLQRLRRQQELCERQILEVRREIEDIQSALYRQHQQLLEMVLP